MTKTYLIFYFFFTAESSLSSILHSWKMVLVVEMVFLTETLILVVEELNEWEIFLNKKLY